MPRTVLQFGWVGVVALSLAGCAAEPKAGDANVDFNAKARPAAVAHVDAHPAGGVQAPPAKSYDEMPTPPKGARYTIYCQSYSGPGHQDVARQTRDFLFANTSLQKWYVIHGNQESTLYYGFYRTVDRHTPADAAEGERALADLDAVRTLHDSRNVRLFTTSLPVAIDSPNPTANPAWDITRSGGYWSLEVAVFKDTPDRKLRAVEAVAEARKMGYPAFYYHGPHASSLCIGSWPKEAANYSQVVDQNVDPDKPLLVTPAPVDGAYAKGLGENVQTAAPTFEAVDPTLIQAMNQWTEHSVNGYTMMRPVPNPAPGQPSTQAERPFPFKIPHDSGEDDGLLPSVDTASATMPPDTGSTAATPDRDAATPGLGKLPSLGD